YAISAWPQIGEEIFAVRVSRCRLDDLSELVEQIDLYVRNWNIVAAFQRLVIANGHTTSDRTWQELAKIVFNPVFTPVDRDLAEPVARRRQIGDTAEVARRVDAVEPRRRLNFDHHVCAGREIRELVVALRVGRRPLAGVVAVAVEKFQQNAADTL